MDTTTIWHKHMDITNIKRQIIKQQQYRLLKRQFNNTMSCQKDGWTSRWMDGETQRSTNQDRNYTHTVKANR